MTYHRNQLIHDSTAACAPEHAIVAAIVLATVLSVGTVIGDFAGSLNLSSISSPSSETQYRPSAAVAGVDSTSPTSSIPNSIRKMPLSLSIFVVVQSVLVIAVIALSMRKKKRKNPIRIDARNEHVFREYANAILLTLRHENTAVDGGEPSVRQFMNTKFGSILESAPSIIVEKQLDDSPHDALVVLDKNKGIQGLITRHEFDKSKSSARKMMAELPLRFEGNDAMSTVLRKMAKNNSRFAAVVADGNILGVISPQEISLALQATLQVLKESHAQHRETLLRTLAR